MTLDNNIPEPKGPERSILVVDTDLKFCESLLAEHTSKQFSLKFAQTGKDAQGLIYESKEPFYGIFINPDIAKPSGLSVIRCAFMQRPATPIYMIVNDKTQVQINPNDLKRIGVRQILQKPLRLKEMIELVSPILIHFDAKQAIASAEQNSAAAGSEILIDDPAFVAIRAQEFLSGSQSLFDVFVRLRSGRYLKLLQAGDNFTADRIEIYLKKGVINFYIKKEIHQTYLEYCDFLTSALIKHSNTSIELKTSQTLNQGEETHKFLRAHGISDKNLNFATRFVKNVHDLTEQIKLKEQDPAFEQFLSNVAQFEHGAGTCLIASLLSQQLEIEMDHPVQIIGLASYFHDIGLLQLPETMWSEDQAHMTADQKKLFHTHPERGAIILGKIRGVFSAAVQAVEQHHMRIQGPSFPPFMGTKRISRVAEIVAISDEFQKYVQKAGEVGVYSHLRPEIERKVFPFFSRQIVYAFRSAFFPSTLPNP